ncbi:bifunctional diguanylate cyclase/phosphodiesterase [Methylovorus sp. MP688]|uniref:putative bifunctional diguanylate cyclase/phosphodiesterase n=1 Tax=Methylovorus sp. (strain MP688) TaxID=887061 RepID=UPI0001EC444B|nr:EAL domain-containing protein [Methylovorus sp. MP688]ADQ83605.1 diguanylate phosphodiesterase [Methylovorus sp. MP688]
MPHLNSLPMPLRFLFKLLQHELPPYAQEPHNLRVRMLLAIGGWSLIMLCSMWGAYYLCHGKWLLMASHAILIALGIYTLILINAGRERLVAISMSHGLLVMLCVICWLDVPTQDVPRSVHMYFLPVAAGASLIFRKENLYLRLVLPFTLLACCLIFASSHIGIVKPELIADQEIRLLGAWINNLAALAILGVALIVMQTDISTRHSLYADMRAALAQGQFRLHYQPQVDAVGNIFGAEALLRWQHPVRGMIPPGVFIAAAEETGLIQPIGTWVLKEACAQLVKWSKDPNMAHLSISVNVSASQLRQPDFVQEVIEIVMRSGATPAQLKLELTESMLAKDVDTTIQKMKALRAFGISWSLDDFGTGYSSLNYLKHLPFEQLKIDQSFVRDLLTNESDKAIVETLVVLSKNLNMMLIAEGVETIEQLHYLLNKGCMKYQGYLFSKPLPIEAFEQFLPTFHLSHANIQLKAQLSLL